MNKRTAMAIVAAAVIVAITIATRAMIAMLTQQTSFSLALFSNNANAQQENITGKRLVQTRDIADGAITNPKLASDTIQPHYEFTSQAAGSLLIPAHKWIDFQSFGYRDGGIAVAGGYKIYSPNHREIK